MCMFFRERHSKRFRKLEVMIMTVATDIRNKLIEINKAVRANNDATASIGVYVTGLKEQLETVKTDLAAALETIKQNNGNNNPNPAPIDELGDVVAELDAILKNIDADSVAENALINTPNDPAIPTDPAPVEPVPEPETPAEPVEPEVPAEPEHPVDPAPVPTEEAPVEPVDPVTDPEVTSRKTSKKNWR